MTVDEEDIGKSFGDYIFLHVLGKGQSSRVQLAINRNTQKRVAVKIQSKQKVPEASIQKEVLLHKQITKSCSKLHQITPGVHLIKLLDFFQDAVNYYNVLEYAGGGELFDLIEPDLGLEEDLAHYYFYQLIHSLKFLHSIGIAHRDLKPENLLLDETGNLCISDFGLSTIFQHQGASRMLTTPCGSPVYVAPEVLQGLYHGPAADIWSCGIILFAMLVGNSLWEKPTLDSPEFRNFRNGTALSQYPWNRLPSNIRDLLLGMLIIDWRERFTITQISASPWFNRKNPIFDVGLQNYLREREKRRAIHIDSSASSQDSTDLAFALSQPSDISSKGSTFNYLSPLVSKNIQLSSDPDFMSFSQPPMQEPKCSPGKVFAPFTYALDHIDNLKTFATERLTRFFTRKAAADIFLHIGQLLQNFLIPFQACDKSLKIVFSTVDKRKCILKGFIQIRPVSNTSPSNLNLVLFNKIKGDPIEFKRFYKIIFQDLMECKAIDTATSFSLFGSDTLTTMYY